jgi:hypothetical protein
VSLLRKILSPVLLVALSVCAVGARADDIIKPKLELKPKDAPTHHRFYDRTAKLQLITAGTLMTWDIAQTTRNLSHGGHEYTLPTQSPAGIAAIQLGIAAASEGISFLLHKSNHHRLERLPRLYVIAGSARGLLESRFRY